MRGDLAVGIRMSDIIEILHNRLVGRVARVGVGNPIRGDDGAGPHVIARLEGRRSALLIDAGEVPENYVGKIAAWRPDVVCVIDAASLRCARCVRPTDARSAWEADGPPSHVLDGPGLTSIPKSTCAELTLIKQVL
jgi:hypothetical protein